MLPIARPRRSKSLEERLRTRFEWGLTADVQPPDFETRVAIVKRKAELLHLDLPEDVAEFIANHLKNNIRQLEGAVKKLNAYYMLEGIQPVISVAQNAIKDILNETQPVPVTIEKIIGEVSRTFNVSPADIRGTKRNANVASARRVAIYILREVTGMSMEEIGREFSGRDHSTIVYSLKTMERDMKNDQHLRETVSDIIKTSRPETDFDVKVILISGSHPKIWGKPGQNGENRPISCGKIANLSTLSTEFSTFNLFFPHPLWKAGLFFTIPQFLHNPFTIRWKPKPPHSDKAFPSFPQVPHPLLRLLQQVQ